MPDPYKSFHSLLSDCERHVIAVSAIRKLAEIAVDGTPRTFGYFALSDSQLVTAQTDAAAKVTHQQNLSDSEAAVLIVGHAWEIGAIPPKLKAFCALRQQAISKLFLASASELELGRLRGCLALARSATEIMAYQVDLARELSQFHLKLERGCSALIEADSIVNSIDELLHKKSFSTRIDLDAVRRDGLLSASSWVLTKSDSTVDLHPKRMSKVFDALTSKVQNSDRLYDFLCEFGHPNAPLHFESVSKENKHQHLSLQLVERTYDTATESAALINTFSMAIGDSVKLLEDCLNATVEAGREIVAIADLLKPIIQTLIHALIGNNRVLFPKHMPCPCQSGLTIGDCYPLTPTGTH